MPRDPKHNTLSAKHDEGNVMTRACIATSGARAVLFIDDVTTDKSSRMNSEGTHSVNGY